MDIALWTLYVVCLDLSTAYYMTLSVVSPDRSLKSNLEDHKTRYLQQNRKKQISQIIKYVKTHKMQKITTSISYVAWIKN